METFDCIQKRRSVKHFLPKMIDKAQLTKILEAATYAPSSGNIANVRFIVVSDKGKKAEIANTTLQPEIVESAPLVIVICSKTEEVVREFKEKGALFAVQNTAAAVENMLLAATDLGLGSLWLGAFSEHGVKKALEIPDEVDVHAIVVIGLQGKAPSKVVRFDPAGVTYFNKWDNKRAKNIESAFHSALSKLKRK